jgi:hypothetical protein
MRLDGLGWVDEGGVLERSLERAGEGSREKG